MQFYAMIGPMTRSLVSEIYIDASYTVRATMGQEVIICQKNSTSVAVFHWSSKSLKESEEGYI